MRADVFMALRQHRPKRLRKRLNTDVPGDIWRMLYFILKAAISGLIAAMVSVIARRWPGLGGLVASLPLVSVMGMIWLWRDTSDPQRMAAHATGTFWFVLPSLPMFLLIPALLKRGVGFWPALMAGCVLTMGLYALTVWIGPKLGLRL
jgi:F0F1-type ATP synthase assembly protein I